MPVTPTSPNGITNKSFQHQSSRSPNTVPSSPNHRHSHHHNQQQRSGMADRITYLYTNLIGTTVRVLLRNGLEYEGIFYSANLDKGGSGVALRMARQLGQEMNANNIITDFIADGGNVVSIEAVDVEVNYADSGILAERQGGFRTDTGISGHSGDISERELQPWRSDDDDDGKNSASVSGGLGDLSLESGSGKDRHAKWNNNSSGRWNQFEANEKLFGVRTDYDEAIYTTELDRNSAAYKQKLKDAERLAREIEGSATDNPHLAEERGQIDVADMDEEARYGAVVRTPAPGSYVPPAARNRNGTSTTSSVGGKPPSRKNSSPDRSPTTSASDGMNNTKITSDNGRPPIPSGRPNSVQASPATAQVSSSSTSTFTPPTSAKKPLGLNANAPSFSFKVTASEFTPSFTPNQAADPATDQRHTPAASDVPQTSSAASVISSNSAVSSPRRSISDRQSSTSTSNRLSADRPGTSVQSVNIFFNKRIRRPDVSVRRSLTSIYARQTRISPSSKVPIHWPCGRLSHTQLFQQQMQQQPMIPIMDPSMYPGMMPMMPAAAAAGFPYMAMSPGGMVIPQPGHPYMFAGAPAGYPMALPPPQAGGFPYPPTGAVMPMIHMPPSPVGMQTPGSPKEHVNGGGFQQGNNNHNQ